MIAAKNTIPRGIGASKPMPSRRAPRRMRVSCDAQGQDTPVTPVVPAVPAVVAVAPESPVVPVPTGEQYVPQMPPVPPYPIPGVPGATPDSVATYQVAADPRYLQGYPTNQQQYYMAVPPSAYAPPASYTPPAPQADSGAPWFIWLGAGVLLAQILGKVQEYMKNPKSPQQVVAEMAMKQMMAGMQKNGGAAPPFPGGAANPFAAMGAAGAANPFMAGAPMGGAGAPNPFMGGFPTPPSGNTVDVTPTPIVNGNGRPGDKFASRVASETKTEGSDAVPLVEPVVRAPTGSSPPNSDSKPKPAFFTDVSSSSSPSSASSAGGATFTDQGTPDSNNAAGAAGGNSATVMSQMMETMMRNPEMQKMLYPYLPEPMRNPQSIEWMLQNPEVRKQMEDMFEKSGMGMSPQMMSMMQNMDFNQDKVNQQFAELGLKPEDVISKVMANPDLASGFSNPKVQAAIMDISSNPMNITKYQNDPEVMKVLEKVTEIFSPQVNPSQK